MNKPAVKMQVWQIQNWGWISCGDQIEGKKTSLVPSFLPVVLFSSWLLILVPSYGTKLESSTPQLWNKTRLQYPPICLTLKEPELLFRNLFSRFWSPVLVFQQKLNSRIQPWFQFHHKGGRFRSRSQKLNQRVWHWKQEKLPTLGFEPATTWVIIPWAWTLWLT